MTTTSGGALAEFSEQLSGAVASAAPAVVYVDANRRRDISGLAWDEHTIVTVDHLLDDDEEIEIATEGNARSQATLAGRDPSTDLAVLRTEAHLTPAMRGDLGGVRVGHFVLALGRDEDGAAAATFGVVSSLDGPWRTWRGGEIDRFMRADLSVYPGFSGGPLVDVTGAVLGINTWGLSRRMALTVPLATVSRVVDALQHGGRIKRGYLGVAMQPVRLPDALRSSLNLAQDQAAIVIDVADGGPAERAGVMIGDILLDLGGVPIGDLQQALGSDSVGATRSLRMIRAGTANTVSLTVGESPASDD